MQALRKTHTKVIPLAVVAKAQLTEIAESRQFTEQPREVIAITTRNKVDLVKIADILYMEADDNYTRIFICDQASLFVARTLKDLSTTLEPEGFMRVHQSYLIHPSRVSQYDMVKSMLLLRSGERIPVSRANRKKIFQKLSCWTGS